MRLPRPLSRGAVLTLGGIGALGVAGAVVAATHTGVGARSAGTSTDVSSPAPTRIVLADVARGQVPWNKPVRIQIENGKLRSVSVTAHGSDSIGGALAGDGSTWTSSETLVPLTRYRAAVVYVDQDHHQRDTVLAFRAADSAKHLKVTLSPGDGNVVGIGSPVVAYLSRAVPKDERAMVEARLSVATSPAVVGAWHWMNDQEVHWRPPTYWKPRTKVTVSSDLAGLYLGNGIWGSGKHAATFHIGDAHVSKVDVAGHQMYVYNNGALIRTMPISAGRDKYPTKNGVHITFEKSQVVTMDSATVGIPRNSPDGYYEKVYWDVRISYGGAFVHAAPWSVGDQGRTNVSHGCVNLSPANATWFYYFSQRGDIVDVYNSTAAPDYADPGMADWNMTWKQWLSGDAAPSAAAQNSTAHLPRLYEPGEPYYRGSSASSRPTSAPVTRSYATPTPTPTRRTPTPTGSPTPTPTRTGH